MNEPTPTAYLDAIGRNVRSLKQIGEKLHDIVHMQNCPPLAWDHRHDLNQIRLICEELLAKDDRRQAAVKRSAAA